MFRPRSIPPRGHGPVARQLARLASGSRVELDDGAIFVKCVRRWMRVGFIADPITSTELCRLNGAVMPVLLSPAWEPVEAVAP